MKKSIFTIILLLFFGFKVKAFVNEKDSVNYSNKKNVVEILPGEFAFNRVGFTYERGLNDYLSLRFPFQFSIEKHNDNTIRNSFGTQLLFFPLKHQIVSYFAGISLKIGEIQISQYYYNGMYYFPSYSEKYFVLSELLNGIRVHMGNYFCLSSSLGVGFIKTEGIETLQFKATGNFGMGFKF